MPAKKYFTEEEKRLARNLNERLRRSNNPEKFKISKKKWNDKNREYYKNYNVIKR